jgi:uncharacterized SAM-binding protein YcdF (DUF218 family)
VTFFFKKILSSLVLPPGPFILVLLAAGVVLLRKRQKLSILLIASGCGLYLLSTEIVSNSLMEPLERSEMNAASDFQGDVIIVLGAGIDDNYQLGGDLMAGVSTGSIQRIMCAYFFWKEKRIPIIFSGGTVYAGGVPEAVAARRILTELGVPEPMLIEEGGSRDTRENVQYSKRIMEERKFQKAVVITSAFHALRAGLLLNRAGVTHSIYRCGATGGGASHWSFLKVLPGPGGLGRSATAINEYLGFALYYLIAH